MSSLKRRHGRAGRCWSCPASRAGRGWSDPADGPQDAARIAADLHTLLDRAAVPGPYVLAGHSFGGLYVLSYAAQFPDDVAGMVLLDSTAPKPGPARPAGSESSTIGRIFALVPAVAHLGIERLLVHWSYDGFPPEVQNSAGVPPRVGLDTAGGSPDRPRRQAPDRPHRRHRKRRHQAGRPTTPRDPVDQQRPPTRPGHPPVPRRRPGRLCRSQRGRHRRR